MKAVRTTAAALAALLLAGCFSLAAPQRREQLEGLLGEITVPVVFDPRGHLAFVRVEEALTFSSGFEEGERLRAQFELPSPVPGFAEDFVAALHEERRLAASRFSLHEISASQDLLAARGLAPVLFASGEKSREPSTRVSSSVPEDSRGVSATGHGNASGTQ